MSARGTKLLKTFRIASLLLTLIPAWQAPCADQSAGNVVWWGQDVFQSVVDSEHTNGVVEVDNGVLRDVVAIATRQSRGRALRHDGKVIVFRYGNAGWNELITSLNTVVAVSMEGNPGLAIHRDGTVTGWGTNRSDESIVATLSNLTVVVGAIANGFLAVKNDGTVLGWRRDNNGMPDGFEVIPSARLVRAGGQILSNVVSVVPMGYTMLVLKDDGSVLSLSYQIPGTPPTASETTPIDDGTAAADSGRFSWGSPYHYSSAAPVMVGGRALSNVIAVAGEGAYFWRSNATAQSFPGALIVLAHRQHLRG
jgi:hypothetical protein